jgi:hypothetical protein
VKDLYIRHKAVNAETVLAVVEHLDTVPDVIATGGWRVSGSVGTAIDVAWIEGRWEFVRHFGHGGARGYPRGYGTGAGT